MKAFSFVMIAMGMGSSALAIEKGDEITNISRGSKFVAVADIAVLANSIKVDLVSGFFENGFQSCKLLVQPSPNERYIKAGTTLVVARVERVKSGTLYPDGFAAKIHFNHAELSALKCFTGEPFGDNHRVPKLGQMERALEKSLTFFPAPATEIPAESICK